MSPRLLLLHHGLGPVLALAVSACETSAPPAMRDVASASDVTRRDTRETEDVDDVIEVELAEAATDVIEVARCDAFFNVGSAWNEGFSGNVFVEYDGPPITTWQLRVDFGIALDLKGAWSGSGLLLDTPVLEGTTIVIDVHLGAESGSLGVELRRFDIGLTALHATDLELEVPAVALDQTTCGALQ